MKTYSIGRDLNCDIVINDSTDVISRRHALLNITPLGKMTIMDQSCNGTYVNGIRISQNVPVPVTRKDIVSLAHVAKLDWNQVPQSNQWIRYVIIGSVAVVILGVIFGINHVKSDNNGGFKPSSKERVDSVAIKHREAAKLDSIKNVEKRDSIKKASEKARQDSINTAKKSTQPNNESKKTKGEDKPNDNKGKEKSSQTNKRAIG